MTSDETLFWQRCIALRHQFGLTQAQLAAEVGTTREVIANGESGRLKPSLSLALAIAGRFGVQVEAMVGGAPVVVLRRVEVS